MKSYSARARSKKFIQAIADSDWNKAASVWTSPDIETGNHGELFAAIKTLTLSGVETVTIKAQKKCEDGSYIDLTNLVYDSVNSRYTTQVGNVYYDGSLTTGQEIGPWNIGGSMTCRIVATFSDDTNAALLIELNGGF